MNADACVVCNCRKAELDGPLRVTKGFCACNPCLMLKTDNCLLPHLVGRSVRVQAPLTKGTAMRVSQTLSLERFADYVDAKILVAVNVHESELDEEGSYWLALLSGPSFVLDEDTMHRGQEYRKVRIYCVNCVNLLCESAV
jgi:hypothetical protein